ncbi:hypothetical protein A3H84_03675 [Candidatus Roizmanbacteria bacterium RIFCSPLOWO2_02_FULL_40_13]|nr:MAG: hypothetical protein A3H84_03675 [Candidatus Roizmanbacteria bacterium RIFCSPLOWO2_02_FULL_40_13]
MNKYIPKEIEKKWQEKWKKDKLFSPDLDKAKNPYYALMMFPYPSAEGLHVGNMYAFTGADIYARFMRLQGYDVFEPMGLDGFGIHSENYALKINKHPMELSKETEKRFYAQLESIGNAFDWTRTVETYKPDYYKWTQWIFLQMYKHGLAYKKKADVNWCPSCKTVLADEQVIAGKCERCGSAVEKKQLEQWFFKITDYAERLLANLDKLDWSEKVKIAQRNWIGKSEGMIINFDNIKVFTTRSDTTDGATFIVLAPEHELVGKFTTKEYDKKVKDYVEKAKSRSDQERIVEGREKTGVFTGSYVVNPVTKKKIPVWIADYVLVGYGTGAIMAVPDADERDKEFAEKFKLPIEKTSFKAKPKGEKKVNYHLRDWLISRQRYWSPPIPIIYCEKCGTVPVPEKDLPVELPYVKNFRPTGTGQSPLASIKEFYEVACPKCKGKARRETDVSDTFLDSAWYFFRYTSTEDQTQPWKKDRVKKWLPVNMYIGGAEHSVLHLLYSRFLSMVFKDIGLYSHFEEPYTQFRAHGLIISEGAKMSKSKGNVVNPDKFIGEYGADTLRTYLMFIGPFDQGGDFREQSIIGVYRFFQRVWALQTRLSSAKKLEKEGESWMGMTVAKVGDDTKNLRFNTAISAMMEWVNYLYTQKEVSQNEYRTLLILLASYGPHMTEELWKIIGEKYSVHQQKWPAVDIKALQKESVNIPVQVNGKLRAVLTLPSNEIKKDTVVAKALELEAVQKHLSGKKAEPIYVEGKILNLIVK